MRSKLRDREIWHPWFAWFPVRVGDARVWLEVVDRKLVYHHEYCPYDGADWVYRLREARAA